MVAVEPNVRGGPMIEKPSFAARAQMLSRPIVDSSAAAQPTVRNGATVPSDSTTTTAPVSATAKFAPLSPTFTRRNFSRTSRTVYRRW